MSKGNLIGLLAGVLLLNGIQAACTQLTGDEALYWMHARHLDWGFRDHPPMTGLWAGLGYHLLATELGVRLMTILSHLLTLWLLFRLARPVKLLHYALLIASVPVMHLYGFTATPDSPLLLATALYLTTWQRFIRDSSWLHTLLLGMCMAFLVWSKYHGLLIILFALLPIKRLWLHKQFWSAACIGILLYLPHLLWQYQHDFPTFKYHLAGRNDDAWEWKHIGGYIGGQLLVFNPVVLGMAIYILVKRTPRDAFERSIQWLLSGVLLLFLFNSFRGRVEPHWTTPVTLCAIILILREWQSKSPGKPVLYSLAGITTMLMVVRIGLVTDIFPPLKKEYHTGKQSVTALHKIAKDKPVCFMNSYQMPSLYMFYTGGIAHSINNIEGGKNQYDLWNYNEYINEKPFLFVASYDAPHFEDVEQDGIHFKIKAYDDLPVLHQLEVLTDDACLNTYPGEHITLQSTITNHNHYPVHLENEKHPIGWLLLFNYKKPNQADVEVEIKGLPKTLQPAESARITMSFIAPDRTGKNIARLAARVDELPHVYLSNGIVVRY